MIWVFMHVKSDTCLIKYFYKYVHQGTSVFLNKCVCAQCNQIISLFVLSFIKSSFLSESHMVRSSGIKYPYNHQLLTDHLFQCDKLLQQTTYSWDAINKYVKDHLNATCLIGKWRFHICKVTYAISKSSELFFTKAIKEEKEAISARKIGWEFIPRFLR